MGKDKPANKVRATFHLDSAVLGDLDMLIAHMKRKARAEGQTPLPTMSDVVEVALRTEIAKRRKALGF